MSPERAKVFVIGGLQVTIKDFLKEDGHEVVLTAATKEGAIKKTKKLEALGVQVAILNNNLSVVDVNGENSQEILQALRKNAPEVKVIGLSTTDIPGVDVDLGQFNLFDLKRTVTEL